MDENWAGTLFPIILFFSSLFAFFFLTKKYPERLSNSILLFLSLILLLPASVVLFGETGASMMVVLAFSVTGVTLLTPVFLIWNGIVMMRRESSRLSNLLSLLLGIGIAAGEVAFLYTVLNGMYNSLLGVVIWLFGLSVLYFSILLLAFVLYLLILPRISKKESFDTVIIHGCALIHGDKVSKIMANRLDMAIDLFCLSGYKALLVVSGGQGDDESISEADAMADYLIEKGVQESRILKENRSHTTEENLKNALSLIQENCSTGKLALVTSGYHLYRCVFLAHQMGIQCKGFGAKVAAYYWPSAVIREFAAVYTRKPHRIYALIGYGVFVLVPTALFYLSLPI